MNKKRLSKRRFSKSSSFLCKSPYPYLLTNGFKVKNDMAKDKTVYTTSNLKLIMAKDKTVYTTPNLKLIVINWIGPNLLYIILLIL